MVWKKGQTGNPEGHTPPRPFLAALNRAIAQNDAKKLRAAAERLLDEAANGEPWAIKELADRLDGKARQDVGVDGKMEFHVKLPWLSSAISERNG